MGNSYLEENAAPTRAQVDAQQGRVVLEFGTAWCGYCNALAPAVEREVQTRADLTHIKVEDGSGRALGRSFRVKLWPNLVLLKDGAVFRQLARPSERELREAFAAFDRA